MTVLIIIIFALIAFILYLFFHPYKKKTFAYLPYLEALIALLENNEETAMKKLKETLNLDTNLVDAYIRLGNLYRKKGDCSRAIQIHQSLTVRPTLKKEEEKKVYFALTEDYLTTNRPNKAISFLKEILKIDKNDKTAKDLIIKIYEDLANYYDCIVFYEEGGLKDEPRRAFYYAALGNSKLKEISEDESSTEKEAVNLFKKALKISPDSLTGPYYFADYFKNKGDFKKAKEYYLKIISQNPDYTFLIISGLEKIFYELGSFDEIIPIYEKIFRANPKNFSVGFALASLYEKKNDLESARDTYRKIAELYPKSILPKFRLMQLMTEARQLKKELMETEKMLADHQFKCRNCGYQTNKFSFICPKCHAIVSFLPYL